MEKKVLITPAVENIITARLHDHEGQFCVMTLYQHHFIVSNNHTIIQLSGPYKPDEFEQLLNLNLISKIEVFENEELVRSEEGWFQVQTCGTTLRKYNNNITTVMLCSYTPDTEEV